MGIFLIILLLICLFWPVITRWLRGYMSRRAEDMIRRMAGMPSRKEEQRRAKATQNRRYRQEQQHRSYQEHQAEREAALKNMRESAVDVEYTEIREYSEDTVIEGSGARREKRIYRESQVTDAEWTE